MIKVWSWPKSSMKMNSWAMKFFLELKSSFAFTALRVPYNVYIAFLAHQIKLNVIYVVNLNKEMKFCKSLILRSSKYFLELNISVYIVWILKFFIVHLSCAITWFRIVMIFIECIIILWMFSKTLIFLLGKRGRTLIREKRDKWLIAKERIKSLIEII